MIYLRLFFRIFQDRPFCGRRRACDTAVPV
jgi:hypothetical protein